MEPQHRKILQRNRTTIIENMAKPTDVNDLLFEEGLFTESMRQEVEAESTNYNQARKILDFVPKRGPTAFEKFYTVMLKSQNEYIADILHPERRGSHPDVGVGGGQRGFAPVNDHDNLPLDWPNQEAMTRPVVVKPCNVRSELVRKYWNNRSVYTLKRRIRGPCVIISNQVFTGPLDADQNGVLRVTLSNRDGTEKDVRDLETLFSQLHFDVKIHREKDLAATHQILTEASRDPALESADCFVFIICSHGTRHGVYCTDGKVITLEQITAYFDSAHCQKLQNKPKLFFIQACQGEETDIPGRVAQELSGLLNTQLNVHDSEPFGTSGQGSDHRDAAPEYPPERTVPSKQDILVACAAHPGFVSFRNTHFGSWFIQAVIHIFQNYACEESIQDLLTMVNQLVGRGRTRTTFQGGEGDAMQATLFTSSLTKKFLFFPGIIADHETEAV